MNTTMNVLIASLVHKSVHLRRKCTLHTENFSYIIIVLLSVEDPHIQSVKQIFFPSMELPYSSLITQIVQCGL